MQYDLQSDDGRAPREMVTDTWKVLTPSFPGINAVYSGQTWYENGNLSWCVISGQAKRKSLALRPRLVPLSTIFICTASCSSEPAVVLTSNCVLPPLSNHAMLLALTLVAPLIRPCTDAIAVMVVKSIRSKPCVKPCIVSKPPVVD